MIKNTKIGCWIIIIGIAMFLFGVSQFSSQESVGPIKKTLGEFSFILWLPTIIVGVFFIIRFKK